MQSVEWYNFQFLALLFHYGDLPLFLVFTLRVDRLPWLQGLPSSSRSHQDCDLLTRALLWGETNSQFKSELLLSAFPIRASTGELLRSWSGQRLKWSKKVINCFSKHWHVQQQCELIWAGGGWLPRGNSECGCVEFSE